jgi:hypothetical protein
MLRRELLSPLFPVCYEAGNETYKALMNLRMRVFCEVQFLLPREDRSEDSRRAPAVT